MIYRHIKCFYSTTRRSYYEILQLQSNATQQQIKSNYYKLAKEYHPDKNISFAERFKLISEAYSTLKDPAKRKQYDQENYMGNRNRDNNDMYGQRTSYGGGFEHSYGYQYRKAQQERQRYDNPYSSQANSTYNFHNEYDFRRGHRSQADYENFMKDMHEQAEYFRRMEKGRMKSPNDINEQIRKAFIVGIGITSVILIAQIIMKIHRFNTISRQRTYYQRLDPSSI